MFGHAIETGLDILFLLVVNSIHKVLFSLMFSYKFYILYFLCAGSLFYDLKYLVGILLFENEG